MSNKLECPSCKSYLSAIYDAWEGELDQCPSCGLSADVIRDVYRVRESHASAEVVAQFEALAVRAGNAERDAAAAKAKLNRIRWYFRDFDWDRWEEPDDD